MPTSVESSVSHDHGPRPSARCEPIDRRRRPTCTGRGSRLCASACRCRPDARPSISTSARLAERGDLGRRSRSRATRSFADGHLARRPRARSTGSGWRNSSSRSGGTTSRPSGFATPLATLARNFVRATPTVIGSPTCSRTPAPQPRGDLGRRARDAARARARRGTPRRSRAPRRAASCPRRPRTPPCSPRGRRRSAARRRPRRGTAAAPAGRPSPCARRTPSPRSSPRGRRRRRRSPAARAAPGRRAARPTRRTSRGRRGGCSRRPRTRTYVRMTAADGITGRAASSCAQRVSANQRSYCRRRPAALADEQLPHVGVVERPQDVGRARDAEPGPQRARRVQRSRRSRAGWRGSRTGCGPTARPMSGSTGAALRITRDQRRRPAP